MSILTQSDLRAYLVAVLEDGRTVTRAKAAATIGIHYNTLCHALNRLIEAEPSLADAISSPIRKTNTQDRLLQELLRLDEAGETTTRVQLAERLDTSVSTISNATSRLRGEDHTALIDRVIKYGTPARRPSSRPSAPVALPTDETEAPEPEVAALDPADALRLIDQELAAISRDRIDGDRLRFRIAGLRSTISDAL